MLTQTDIRSILNNAPEEVFSLILEVDGALAANQSSPAAWEIQAKNAIKATEAQVDDSQVAAWQAIRQATEDFLNNYSPKGKSLVLFVGENGYLADFNLAPSLQHQYAFGAALLMPLLWAIDEYEPCLVVLADREKVQFARAYLGQTEMGESQRINLEQYQYGEDRYVHRQGKQVATQHNSVKDTADAKVDAMIHRFYSEIAEKIAAEMQAMQSKRLILGGNEIAAKQISKLLPETIQAELIGFITIEVDSSEHEIVEAIRNISSNEERSEELDMVNDIINSAKAGGRGAIGMKDVEQAMLNKQVELLLVPYPLQEDERLSKWIREAFRMGASIELVKAEAAERLREEGEIAAKLYYPLPITS